MDNYNVIQIPRAILSTCNTKYIITATKIVYQYSKQNTHTQKIHTILANSPIESRESNEFHTNKNYTLRKKIIQNLNCVNKVDQPCKPYTLTHIKSIQPF